MCTWSQTRWKETLHKCPIRLDPLKSCQQTWNSIQPFYISNFPHLSQLPATGFALSTFRDWESSWEQFNSSTHKIYKKKTYKEVTSKFPLLSPEQRIPLHTEKQGLPSQLLNTLGSPTPFLNASKASAAKKDNRWRRLLN